MEVGSMDEHEKRSLIQEKVHSLLSNGAITHEKFDRLLKAIPTTPAEQLDASLYVLDQLAKANPEYIRNWSQNLDDNRKRLHELVDELGLSEPAAKMAHENAEAWQQEFTKLLDGLDDDTLLSVYDCHI